MRKPQDAASSIGPDFPYAKMIGILWSRSGVFVRRYTYIGAGTYNKRRSGTLLNLHDKKLNSEL